MNSLEIKIEGQCQQWIKVQGHCFERNPIFIKLTQIMDMLQLETFKYSQIYLSGTSNSHYNILH